MPEYAHSGEARWRTAGTTCSGVSSSESSRVEVRVPVTTGEIAGGTHGRNRMMGNSLLECCVFGRRAGAAAAEGAK